MIKMKEFHKVMLGTLASFVQLHNCGLKGSVCIPQRSVTKCRRASICRLLILSEEFEFVPL